jgi:transcriptional regulator with XRE-family HTH domain
MAEPQRPPIVTRHRHPEIDGQALLARRKALGLSLDQVAALCVQEPEIGCAVHVTDISRYERGMFSPPPRKLRVLAKVLDSTPADYLVPPRKERKAA